MGFLRNTTVPTESVTDGLLTDTVLAQVEDVFFSTKFLCIIKAYFISCEPQQSFSLEQTNEEQMAQAIALSLNEEITTETSNGAVAVPLDSPTACAPAASADAEQTPKPSIDFASAAASASVSTSISSAATSTNASASVITEALSAPKPVVDPNSTEKPPAVSARLLSANQNEQNSGSRNMKPK